MRKKMAVLMAALTVALALPASVPATHTAACSDTSIVSRGRAEAKRPNVPLRGVKSTIRVYGIPENCYPQDDDSITSIWIAIEPTPKLYENEIVQMGTAVCGSSTDPYPLTTDDICDPANNGTVRFFAAWGGGAPWNNPIPMDLGPGDWNTHTFEINVGSTNIEFLIDGVRRGLISNDVMDDWPGDWWADTNTKYGVACETWDRGDSCGGFSAGVVKADNVQWKRQSDAIWVNASYADPCDTNKGGLTSYRCFVEDGNTVQFYTVQ